MERNPVPSSPHGKTKTCRTNALPTSTSLAAGPVNQAPMLFDCAKARSALLIDGATFTADGTVTDADWQSMPKGDPILKLVCET